MSRARTVTISCPALVGDDGERCGRPLTVQIDPPEPRTHDYPGCEAQIARVWGCAHVDELTGQVLWDAIMEEEDRYGASP